MEDRDDDDNESAVRALNTAMTKQEQSLKIFKDDPLMVNRPFDEIPASRNSSAAPSDETTTFLGIVSRSDSNTSDVLGAAGVTNDSPAAFVRAGDIDGEDDGIQDEMKNLVVSENLLRKEMERATRVASRSSIEQLSSDLLAATEIICNQVAGNDSPSIEEIRAHVTKEQSKGDEVGSCNTVHNMHDLAFVDDIMETVMDTVLGCKGDDDQKIPTQYARRRTTTATSKAAKEDLEKSPVLGASTPQALLSTRSAPARNGTQMTSSGSRDAPSMAYRSSSMALTDKEKAFVVRELRNARSIATKQKKERDPKLSGHAIGEGNHRGQGKRKVIENRNDSQKMSSADERAKRPSLMERMKSFSSQRKSVPSEEEPRKDVTVCVTVGESSVLTPVEVEVEDIEKPRSKPSLLEQPRSKRSLMERARLLSKQWSSVGGKVFGEITKRKEEPPRSTTSTEAAVHPEIDQEAPAPLSDVYVIEEHGHEVEAFYQADTRVSVLERDTFPEQHREWKNELFKKGWLGMRLIYWVMLLLLAINLLLLGVILLVTDDSVEKSSSQSIQTTNPPTTVSPSIEINLPLPVHTIEALRNPSSPQSKAYEWLIKDPAYFQYSNDRKLQRMALATLYYSTNGPNWTFANSMLTYDSDECQWFYNRAARASPAACGIAGGLIESLMLDQNNLEGKLPPELWLMTSLKFLSLANNQLTSTIPSEGLEKLTDLQFFGVTKSGLSGPIPPSIGYLSNLELLDLSANRFTSTIPITFRNLSKLRELRLHKNGLNGTLPDGVLFGLSNLQQMYLFENQLSGSIPSSIKHMHSVEDLFLYNNRFSSSLPTDLGHLTRLQRLWLDRNRFTGQIPKQLGNLHMLMQLSLFSNELSGTIPRALSNARSLQQVRLEDNLLTGQVPDRVCDWFSREGDDNDLDIEKILSVDCIEVSCNCNCNCPRPGSEGFLHSP
ncbi:Leucine Rich Repeat [Seminavis robusta]|uniref:Leucine Rich Repeat n=1 Tax=Seminavis robusta TaxID=568900 RepID=A0A9N8DQ52_9STRA|nr:Leucine Rich Repeat [Seminavis robusta]|eukprot:Sro179_g078520.1 Leucine Rich Repeat (947) ;mRNA; r:54159-57065